MAYPFMDRGEQQLGNPHLRSPHPRPDDRVQLIRVEYQPGDLSNQQAFEEMWAKPLGRRRYQIASIPFWVDGLSRFDIVEITGSTELSTIPTVPPTASRLVKRLGHSTYRCWVHRGIKPKNRTFQAHWKGLERLGCDYEAHGICLIAIDVPPQCPGPVINELLDRGAQDQVWTLHEGHHEHPIAS